MDLLKSICDEESSDKYLYHYSKLDSIMYILESNELKFSELKKLDDPFESALGVIGGFLSSSGIDEQIGTSIARSETRLISFCIDDKRTERKNWYPYNKGYAHSRMWDQYAEKHKGGCLVFDREELITNISSYVKSVSGDIEYLNSVVLNYTNALENTLGVIDFENKEIVHDLFFTKTQDYVNECEYRILLTDKLIEKVNYGNALKAVIVRIDNKDLVSNIKMQYIKKKIELFGISWILGEPSIFQI
jgi:hypothetical protein